MIPRIAFFASVLSNALPALASCARGTSLHRRSGQPIETPEFGYGTTDGPINWHGLSEENLKCAVGKNQSPINIGNTIVNVPAGFVDMEIPQQDEVEFENLGTNVEVIINGTTVIDNEVYTLEQFHFHTPSEHRINNEHYPVEAHMVHEAQDQPGKIAVVGMVLQLTDGSYSTDALNTVISQVNEIPETGRTTTIHDLNMESIVSTINSSQFYYYSGSLTTPPCAEDVTFLIATEPFPIGFNMYNDLKAVVGMNARHIQSPQNTENVIVTAARNLAEQEPAVCSN